MVRIRGIFIDAGHGLGPTGAMDNGAIGRGTTERQEVTEMARETVALLRADPDFAVVEIIPIGVDTRLRLIDKIVQVNAICAARGWMEGDAFLVSIHINAASDAAARGLEAWHATRGGAGINFSRVLIDAVAQSTGLPLRTRPVRVSSENRHGRLGILDDTKITASLLEMGFITNEFDARTFKDMQLDDRFAEGIRRGIRVYLGLPASPASVPTVTPLPSALFLDVPANAWYAKDVEFCTEEGIFERRPEHPSFHPERPVTRAELAAVIARHLHKRHPSL
ncbi:MAG: hypothetical protein Greene041619_1154 [Candidatus Peregrinibacteria bacterium Greene0416_19]|nr:MAG: hypothetical protein Greene041619_1154 [Candidatus Peregrinibacteria bacterium Greene0416_19]